MKTLLSAASPQLHPQHTQSLLWEPLDRDCPGPDAAAPVWAQPSGCPPPLPAVWQEGPRAALGSDSAALGQGLARASTRGAWAPDMSGAQQAPPADWAALGEGPCEAEGDFTGW